MTTPSDTRPLVNKTCAIRSVSKIIIFIFFLMMKLGQLQAQKSPSINGFHDAGGFIENRGQILDQFHEINHAVKYLLTTPGLNVQLRTDGFSYDTYEMSSKAGLEKNISRAGNKKIHDTAVYRFHRIDVNLLGANAAPKIIAEEEQDNYTTYYNAKNTKGIIACRYNKITYKHIYQGIELIFESNDIGFEYYFVVRPGADANAIRLQYAGAPTKLENGKVVMELENRKVEERIPASFITGDTAIELSQLNSKSAIPVAYKKLDKNVYGFRFPKYPKERTLVIDPTPDLVWGTYYGGPGNEEAYTMALDAEGNVIIGGGTDNPNLATAGAYKTTIEGISDAILGKFKGNGDLVWMTYYGGESTDEIHGVCTDAAGNIYCVGITDSKTGISTPGSFQPIPGNLGYGRDGFLVKFSPAGNRLWATYYGGDDIDYAEGVKVDPAGNVFMVGWTWSPNNIATPGSFQPTYASSQTPQERADAFLARFDGDGNRVWATYYGGVLADVFNDVAIDKAGNICAVGNAASNGLATAGTFQATRAGGNDDGLVVKFTPSGARLWATYYGGGNEDNVLSVACDGQNNVLIGGTTFSTDKITTPGAYLATFAGGSTDGFVAKLDQNGGRLWGTYYGGNGTDYLDGLSVDINDNVIISGATESHNNMATANAYEPTLPSTTPGAAFIAKLDGAGNRLWGTYYGYGNQFGEGEAFGVAADGAGNIFACGETQAYNGISTCMAVRPFLAGNQDMFVAMFSETVTASTVSVNVSPDQSNVYCPGKPISFTAVVINGGTNTTFQWQVNGVNAGTNNAVFTSASLNSGDKVSCTVVGSSPCATNTPVASNIININLNPSVVPAVSINADFVGSICIGTAVTFTATPTNGGNAPQYQWKINGNITGTDNPVFKTTALVNGDLVTCTLTNLQSCNTINTVVSNPITVNVNATVVPVISIIASQNNICASKPITFSVSATNAGANPTYQWSVNNNIVGAGVSYTTASLSNNDIIQCALLPGSLACSGSGNILSNKVTASIFPLPQFTIMPATPFIKQKDTLQLSLTGTANIASLLWSPAQSINDNTISNPKVWPFNTVTYSLTASSMNGCTNTKEVTVTIITKLWIPNAFSPNGDGINDLWVIRGMDAYPDCQVSIFNRYGQCVFQSNGYKTPWDGRFNGQKILPDTYVYLIDLKNNEKPLSGTVTIIR